MFSNATFDFTDANGWNFSTLYDVCQQNIKFRDELFASCSLIDNSTRITSIYLGSDRHPEATGTINWEYIPPKTESIELIYGDLTGSI